MGSSMVNSISEGFGLLLNTFLPKQGPNDMLPPTVKGVINRAAFPLGFGHSTRYIGPKTALVGDAAHRIHPLAGQGVNLGFGDVSCLTDLLSECARVGGDVGGLSHLQRYETLRQRAVLPVVGTIGGLEQLYSTSFGPTVLLRSLGLQAVNSVP